jgi:glycopeptide antibiotics resistance protein
MWLIAQQMIKSQFSIGLFYWKLCLLVTLFAFVFSYLLFLKKRITFACGLATTLLVGYVFLVFSSTVFSRNVSLSRQYNLLPFWSYYEIAAGDKQLFVEDILNVFLLMPVGLLLPLVFRNRGYSFFRLFWICIGTGFCLSLSIELLQLIFCRGLFELDDLFHNTLGAMLGYLIYCGLHRVVVTGWNG